MKILFAQSYHLKFDPKLWAAMQPYAPTATLIAAAIAREEGHEVYFADSLFGETDEGWIGLLNNLLPDAVILYEDNFNYLSKMCLLNMRDAASRMIKKARKIAVNIIVCSSDATDHPDLYLDAGADYILAGEGDQTLKELLTFLNYSSENEISSINGLLWKGLDGEIQKSAKRDVIRNLDELPMPAWDLVDINRYKEIWQRHHGYFSLSIATSRGCPYHCNWCAKPLWGRHYNVRSPRAVVDEMLYLKTHYQPDHIWFMDDIFGLKPCWLEEFADLIEHENIQIPFKCLNRANLLLRKDDISHLVRAGCSEVWIGAESGSQKILDAMEKGTKIEELYAASHALKSAGIKVGHFIQYGYPGETWQDIKMTLKMVRKILPDRMGISVSYPLPGTPFYDRVKEQLTGQQNWHHSDDFAMMYKGPYDTRFYRLLHKLAHKDLYIHKAFTRGFWAEKKSSPYKFLRRMAGVGLAILSLIYLWPLLAIYRIISKTSVEPLLPEMSQDEAATPFKREEAL